MLDKKELKNLLKEHNTSLEGLPNSEVKIKRKEYGLNEIKAKKKKPLILVFFEEFKDLLVIILIIAAILAFIAGEKADAIVILFVVMLNATIGFIQTFKAEKAIEALRKLIAPHARVIRNGKEQEIDAKLLVPGDILILDEGASITADALLIEANELQAQESALTGESVPVHKFAKESSESETTGIDRENMVYMGTNVTHGAGQAIVISIGMQTQMGRIAELTTETKADKSPLERELFRIGIFVGKVAVGISAILFAVGYFIQGKEFIETLLFASSVAVAAVPEGLPATITIALAIGVQRLAKKNAIVKQLSAAETLGSTTVICSDKTGTLTKNEMTVKEIFFDGYEASVHGVGYDPYGTIHVEKKSQDCVNIGREKIGYGDYEKNRKDLLTLEHKHPDVYASIRHLSIAAGLCNNASLEKKGKHYHVLGDPTEGALLTLVRKLGFDLEALQKEYEEIYQITFDSSRKRMTVILKGPDKKYYAYTKGAPVSILESCSHVLTNGHEIRLDDETKEKYLDKNEYMAKNALRGLGYAYRELTQLELEKFEKSGEFHSEEIEKDMIFLGLTGMIDPPRPEVKEAVHMAKDAHLRIYIVTGDHGLTAEAIASQLEIITKDREHKIITGVELNKLTDKEIKKDLKNKKLDIIFARVSPEHKLRIVTLLKELHETVAVTGDGVNDAPALKKADIGIAMGISGTDVSKEASNMVLADDSFSSIIHAIKEGRTIYDNLKKFVFYMFSCNIGELVTVFAAILLFLPPPLTAVLILAVNLGTDVLPAVALGVDPAEPGIMKKKPRDPQARIMDRDFIKRFLYIGTVIGAIVMGVYIWTLMRYGWSWGEPLSSDNYIQLKGSSVAFALLVLIQMVQAFNSRSEKNSILKLGFFSNKYLLGAIATSLILVVIMIEVPLMQKYLHTVSLDFSDWGLIIAASFIVIFVEEIRKIFVRKRLAEVEVEE
ncbi:cation-translocating P-type ATPase [Pseudomonadota bacterium]